MSGFDLFDRMATPPVSPSPSSLTSEGEAHAKLKRNLNLALDRHDEILGAPLDADTPARDKRLVAEVATATIKAALTTDRTALKARQDNALEIVFLRVLFHAKRLGRVLEHADAERLKNATRAELEAALGPRQIDEYDRMEFGNNG